MKILIKISLLNFNHVHPGNQPINLDVRVNYVQIVNSATSGGPGDIVQINQLKYDATDVTEAH